jgi:hypothetical protein
MSIGFRRNLKTGGFWKATYVHRDWINNYDWYPNELMITRAGQLTYSRIMRNDDDGYERYYNGVELEWEFPFHKRFTFGGNYTWNRLMMNTSRRIDESGGYGGGNSVGGGAATQGGASAPDGNMDKYLDWYFGGRQVWAPTRLVNPEHIFKFYFLFDLSSGRFQQTLGFTGNYTSGQVQWRNLRYDINWGSFLELDPDMWYYLFRSPQGGAQGAGVHPTLGAYSSTSGTSGVNTWYYIEHGTDLYQTGQDWWDLQMRYMVTVPKAKKLAWFNVKTVSNPFNHRGIGGWVPRNNPDSGLVRLRDAPGYDIKTGEYAAQSMVASDPYHGAWYVGGNHNGAYNTYQGGRGISLQSGLRF